MKILIVCDIDGWAISSLAKSVQKFNRPHHDVRITYVHPRDAGLLSIQDKFLMEVEGFKPDLIQFEYFRTCGQLVEAIPELKKYKLALMHHNMRTKAVYMWNWQDNTETDKTPLGLDKVIVHCNRTKKMIEDKGYGKEVAVIRYGFDHNYWTYDGNEPEELIIGYAGRIVPWKGMKELSEVADELNYPIEMMGRIEKADYWETCTKDTIRFSHLNCTDDDRINFYRNITIFVQNSKDGYESGTMPLMEAMATGVPVVTTPAGQSGLDEGVMKDRVNCLMVPFEDKDALKDAVDELMSDKKLRNTLRKNAWNTIKNYTEERMAKDYSRIWNKVIFPVEKLASVIIPCTYDRIEQLREILEAYQHQTYKNFEVIVAWDENTPKNEPGEKYFDVVTITNQDNWGVNFNFPIKQVWTEMDKERYSYNLGKARNLGVIEAEGEYLVFNDSRLKPEQDVIRQFVTRLEGNETGHKIWVFGEKGGNKNSFVENFSAAKRSDIIEFGMFNERMDAYGGMTQELRSRWKKQGGDFGYQFTAVAEEIKSSKMTNKKRLDIVNMKNLLNKLYGNERI